MIFFCDKTHSRSFSEFGTSFLIPLVRPGTAQDGAPRGPQSSNPTGAPAPIAARWSSSNSHEKPLRIPFLRTMWSTWNMSPGENPHCCGHFTPVLSHYLAPCRTSIFNLMCRLHLTSTRLQNLLVTLSFFEPHDPSISIFVPNLSWQKGIIGPPFFLKHQLFYSIPNLTSDPRVKGEFEIPPDIIDTVTRFLFVWVNMCKPTNASTRECLKVRALWIEQLIVILCKNDNYRI